MSTNEDGLRQVLVDAIELMATELPDGTKLKALEHAVREALAGRFPMARDEPATRGQVSACNRCGDMVLWLRTQTGKMAPVQQRRLVVTTIDGASVSGYESHFAVCRSKR